MLQLITFLHILVAVSLIALVLLQQGKGADVGAAFGSGASNTMFGAQGSTPFLVKVTAILALVFFITSATLSFVASKRAQKAGELVLPTASAPVVPPVTSTPTEAPAKSSSILLPPTSPDKTNLGTTPKP